MQKLLAHICPPVQSSKYEHVNALKCWEHYFLLKLLTLSPDLFVHFCFAFYDFLKYSFMVNMPSNTDLLSERAVQEKKTVA
jgi:hypothetical protein